MSAPPRSVASSQVSERPEFDVDDLEATFHDGLRLLGALVWTDYNGKLIFVPIEGFPTTPSLEEMAKCDLYCARMTAKQRNTEFTLLFDDTGDTYKGKLFARIEEGKRQYMVPCI